VQKAGGAGIKCKGDGERSACKNLNTQTLIATTERAKWEKPTHGETRREETAELTTGRGGGTKRQRRLRLELKPRNAGSYKIRDKGGKAARDRESPQAHNPRAGANTAASKDGTTQL